MLVLFLVGASNYIDRNIIGVLLEQVKTEFHASDTRLGLLSGLSFAVLYASLGIPVARWADLGNRKVLITLALAAWSVMTCLCGFASTFWQLLVFRFAVGAGEAGAIPPAQSLLADYWPPMARARAIGIFNMSSTVGYGVALVLGGAIAQAYGWRAAFITVGILGGGFAPLTYFVLKEPRQDARYPLRSTDRESTLAAMRNLLGKPAFRNIVAGIVLYFLMSYGALVFIVSFMIREHGLSVARSGLTFGTISAFGAIVGNLSGGALADRLASRDIAWFARLGGWGMIVALPLYELSLSAPTIIVMVPLLFLATVVLTGLIPAMFAALHAVCGSKRRALAVAVAFFFANLIGLGLGPVLAGSLSDALSPRYGLAEGLRYALMTVMTAFVPAGWFLLRAAPHIKTDAEP